VLDVGCASAQVLDSVHAVRASRGIGFDLSPYGVRQRQRRPNPPLLAQAVVEEIPLRDEVADVVIFGEVIEHLVDPYAGLREASRVTRPSGIMILTTNNSSEMPVSSPLADPLSWVERLVGRWHPSVLAFRNLTWDIPIPPEADPLPVDSPTYAPHVHMAFTELRDLAADAGFELISSGSFEFPAPQSRFAGWLRKLHDWSPNMGRHVSNGVERIVAAVPGLSAMGTHNLLVLRKVRPARTQPTRPWWPASLVDDGQTRLPE
jgi:SAM-dependent methyltransferase